MLNNRKCFRGPAGVLSLALLCVASHGFVYAQSPATIFVPDDTAQQPGRGRPTSSARAIVRLRPGVSSVPGVAASRSLGAANLYLVDLPRGLAVAEGVRQLKQNPAVLYAEPDFAVSALATPGDPLWSQQWDMVKISAPTAWDLQTDSSDVIVAIIDTGVDFSHPDLGANLWTNPADGSHGFTCMNGSCTPGGLDDYGHGTHVAGTIGAVANNGAGIAGINWRSKILSCKFLGSNGSGNVSDAILCFNQILTLKQQGFNIRVTNNSWGGGGFSQALKDAMEAVEAAGIVNVCAAGNSGVNSDLAPMYPGAYDNRGIVSVLASDSNDAGAYFTNYGVASVDIAAPGVSTLSTVPTGSCALCDPSGYRPASGTSMATPHVTGVLAAMFHLNPSLSAAQARDALLDPTSYDPVSEARATLTSTGGRLNMKKAITSPRLTAPILNNFPVVSSVPSVVANAGDMVNLATVTASDPDNDPLRTVWARGSLNSAPGASSLWLLGSMLNTVFPNTSGSAISFTAPALARTALASYAVSVSDGRGGSATVTSHTTILPTANPGQPPSGNLTVSPTSGPVGTVISVNFPVSDPEGGSVAWDLWQTGDSGGFGWCCQTGSSFNLPINQVGAFRITVQAVDKELNFSTRQSAVVRIGGATGTPPIARAVFDRLTGPVPLTVNIDMTSSSDPDGTISQYTIECEHGSSGAFDFGPTGSCTFDTPGNYWIMLKVKDNSGLLDILSAYAVVTPAQSSSGKSPAGVVLSNLTQTYTGSPLTPAATTNPPGLPIVWTNAPQTNPGTYAVVATVNDPVYEGSASGTFTISSPTDTATVTLTNLTQTYTGNALAPDATTNPPGLSVVWTNAPQTHPGTYSVTATVNDTAYRGSAAGTFTINKATATVSLSDLTQMYTGAPLTPTVTTDPPGLAVAWANAPQTNAGSYTVTATINDPNYQGSASGSFTITKGAATVTLSNLSQAYTGSPLTPTATTNPAGLAVTWTNAPQTAAGSYNVTATINDANYQGSASGTFTITSSGPSVTLSNLTQTYTGSTLTPTATTNPPGLTVTWTNAPQTHPGTYAVTASVNSPSGQASASGTFTINKAAATVTLSNLSQAFTGSPLTPTATTNPPGLPIVWTNAPQTAAGSYNVTATVNDPNYQGSASGTFTITADTATVVLSDLTQTYTGSPLTPTATTHPAGLNVVWTNAPQTNAGTYTVTATIDHNHHQGSATGTFTILKAAATVTLSNLTRAYTGAPLTPTATTNPPGLAIVWTNAPQTNPGAYAVTATVNDPNYQGSASGSFSITGSSATVTLSNLTQTYTGSPLTPTATTNPPGLPIVWTNAPQTNAGSYSVTATINSSSYQGSATGTFTINKATATVTLGSLTQAYTGGPLSPTATTNPAGLAIHWTNAPQTNPGSYTVTAAVTDPNYQGSASGTFTINGAPGGPTPPSVTITDPLSGGITRGTALTIQVSTTTGSSPIARVDFLVNGVVKCSDTDAAYTCDWTIPSAPGKTYELKAIAYDTFGRTGESSIVTILSTR